MKCRRRSPSSAGGWRRWWARSAANSGGWTVPARNGQGLPSGATACWKWLDTIAPRIGSAGELGHQPTTSEVWPVWLRMFQTAFVLRERIVIGRTVPDCGSGSEKPWMPCFRGRLPVAMLVQSIGERGGWSVARLPITPFSTSRPTWGMSPMSTRGEITFQSAASQPTRRTRRRFSMVIRRRPWWGRHRPHGASGGVRAWQATRSRATSRSRPRPDRSRGRPCPCHRRRSAHQRRRCSRPR